MLTDQQKQEIVKLHGLDPSQYTMDDNGTTFVAVTPKDQPAVNPTPYQPKLASPKNSALSTGIKTFAENAIPAFAGGAGAGLTGALLSSTGVGSLVGIPLMALAAYGSAKGASAIQRAVEPDAWEANVAQAQAEHPIAAFAGGLATIPLSGFSPNSLGNLSKAAGGLVKSLPGQMGATADEVANLANVGLGAALPPIQSIVESQAQGQGMPGIGELLGNAAIGAVMSRPNKMIGQRLFGFHDIPNNLSPDFTADMMANRQMQQQPSVMPMPGNITPEQLISAGGLPVTRQEIQSGALKTVAKRSDKMAGYKQDVRPVEEDLARLEGEGGIVAKEPEITEAEKAELIKWLQQKAEEQKTPERIAAEAKLAKIKAAKEAELEPSALPKRTQEDVEDLRERRALGYKDKYQEESNLGADVIGGLTAADKSSELTPEWMELAKLIGAKRGIKFGKNTEMPQAGRISVPSGERQAMDILLAELNPAKAKLDSPTHELFHGFVNDLRNSTRPKDIEFVKKYDALVAESPEYKAWAEVQRVKGSDNSVEEFQATQEGLQSVRNALASGKGYWPKFKKEFGSYLQTRWGKHATTEDFARMGHYKLLNDKSNFDVAGILGKSSVGHDNSLLDSTKTQDESPLNIDAAKLEMAMKANQQKQTERTLLDPTHDDVKDAINFFTISADKVKPEFVEASLQKIANNVDWTTNPMLKRMMLSDEFDMYNPESWKTLRRIYNNTYYPSESKTVNLKTQEANIAKAKGIEVPRAMPVEETETYKAKQEAKKPIKEASIKSVGEEPKKPNIQEEGRQSEEDKKQIDNLMEALKTTRSPDMTRNYARMLYNESLNAYRKSTANPSEQYRLHTKMRTLSLIDSMLEQKYNLEKREPLDIKYQEESPLAKTERSSFAPFLTSRIDRVSEKIKTPLAKEVSGKLHQFRNESDLLVGRIGNELIRATEGLEPPQVQRVYKYLYDMDNAGKSAISLTNKEKTAAAKFTETVREPRKMQIEMGLQVKAGQGYREAGIKPEGYIFNELDPKVAHEWANNPKSAEAKMYESEYINHLVSKGLSKEEATTVLREYQDALASNVPMDTEFGALRKAEGMGLPWKLVDQNLHSAAMRYAKRAARDLAYFKYLQNDPRMLKALNLRDQYGKLPDVNSLPEVENISRYPVVQEALRSVFGIDKPKNPTIMAAARAFGNVVMGVGTSARNIANMPAFVAQYVQGKQISLVAKALANLNESKVRAFRNNAIRADFAEYDAAGYYEGAPNPVIRLFNNFSNFMRKYQGRTLSDKFEGAFYYSLGEQLAVDNIARAKLGDKEALRFLNRFSTIVEGGKEKLLKGKVEQDDVERIAKSFVDAARGTYDESGLPSWALEGELAPFAALSRFSIEKSNTIWKDVIEPMKQGIYGPFLRYTLGSFGVGLLIEQLNEALSNKRGQDPTVSEVIASGNTEDLMAKAVALLQLSSFAGSVSDAAKLVINAAQGKTLKYNQPLSFPLYSFVTDTLAGNMSDAVEAMRQGEDPFQVMGSLVSSIATQSLQTARYIDANYVNPEEAKRKEKFRDLRVFNELNDYSVPEDTGTPNQFLDGNIKQFKRSGNLEEAASMVPDLIDDAIKKSNGSFEELKKQLQKIKTNSYKVAPDFQEQPQRFMDYYNHLVQTQGQEAADKLVSEFITQKSINTAKSSMIPSL